MPRKRKMRWIEKPSRLRAKVDRFGFRLAFANPKNKIVHDVETPDGQHRLTIAVKEKGRICAGVSQEEWDSNAYGLRTAIEEGLRMREKILKNPYRGPSGPTRDSPRTLVCPQCGIMNRDDAVFCSQCGSKI